jgi:hypothetical protein
MLDLKLFDSSPKTAHKTYFKKQLLAKYHKNGYRINQFKTIRLKNFVVIVSKNNF